MGSSSAGLQESSCAPRADFVHFGPAKTPAKLNPKEMKLRLLTLTLISALVAMPVLRAQDNKEDTTELGDKMDKISGAFRKLGKQISDSSKNEDSLAQVAIIKDAATAASQMEPAKKKDLPPDAQAKFVADFQAKMKDFIATVDKLAAALKANDNTTAANILKDMKTMEDDDHKDFRKKKQKKST